MALQGPSLKMKFAEVLILWSIVLPAVTVHECPEGRVCPASYPVRSGPGSETCDTADAEEIRTQIRGGVADAIEAEVTPRLNSILRLKYLGQNSRFPAESCLEILQEYPESLSGEYWVENSAGNVVSVYCDMTLECGNNVTGWTRVANVNMSDPNQQCPGTEFVLRESPVRVCERSVEYSCNSASIEVQSITYSRVCGRVIGYQIGTGDGIKRNGSPNSGINDPYLDGVSLTYDSPRQHIWSFAGYTSEVFLDGCPCYDGLTLTPPSFVGDDLFCESGAHDGNVPPDILFADDPLWDGMDCRGHEAPCCNGPPWFYKELPAATSANIELRLCSDQERADEEVSFQIVELYVQ